MVLLKKSCEKIILIIITVSILIMFLATPASYAKLDLKEGEFYYSGTTKGTYTVKEGIFAWLLDNIGQIADWLLGIITMGFRMVFVGWTALIEKLLTWGLESTVGVNVAGEEVDGMSNTDLTSITDSTNNLTVQAIVYNRVPAFDINFFDLSNEYDKTVSGTGKILICEKCNKKVAECCKQEGSTFTCCTECGGTCDACHRYMLALLNAEDPDGIDPIVLQLKKIVATWYYILRILSMAIMLVVLIGVGIKMVVSTIASEKAVYKRMLVDWLVGAIIVFSIHYIMLFIININESLVDIISESADNVNSVQMKQLSEKAEGDKGVEKSNEEIEIDIYEAVRTRAYDPKLTNGLSGMLMYMTLVYFAIRYSIVYIQRYLTVLVLTLMGPPVGVAYALQKVLSGKSSSLKIWMKEYVMNVIIQSVHAIIYGVFISSALILSLQSIPGIIVALILMNFSLKAESTFRKIFKFGDGDSLVGHTAEAGNAEKMKQNLDTAVGLYAGAKPLAGALMNSPYGKAVKGVGKVAAAGGVLGIAGAVKVGKGIKNKITGGNGDNNQIDSSPSDSGNSNSQDSGGGSNSSDGKPTSGTSSTGAQVNARGIPVEHTSMATLMEQGEGKLRADVEAALSEVNATKPGTIERTAAEKKYEAAMKEYTAYKEKGFPSTKDIVKGHIEQLVDIENHFSFTKNAKGSYLSLSNLGKLKDGVFGTKYYDAMKGKMISNGDGLYSQLGASKLLGFSDEDKKLLKEQILNPMKNGLGGMAMMFFGAGTLIAHPTLGMGLLTAGSALSGKTFKKPSKNKKYKGRYGFSRFSTPSMIDVQKSALSRARREMNSVMASKLKNDHPDFYKELQSGLKKDYGSKFKRNFANSAKAMGGTAAAGLVAGAGIAAVPLAGAGIAGMFTGRFIENTALSDNLSTINKHSVKQMREQQQQFVKDAMTYQSNLVMARAGLIKNGYDSNYDEKAMAELGYKRDPITKKLVKVEDTAIQKQLDYLQQKLVEKYASEGKDYDPTTGKVINRQHLGDSGSASGIQNGDIQIFQKKKSRKLTDSDIKNINKVIDNMLDEIDVSQIDLNDDTNRNNFKALIEGKLKDANIIAKNENIGKGQEDNILNAIKRRKEFNEKKLGVIADETLRDNPEKSSIEKAFKKVSKNKTDIKLSDILEQMKKDFIKQEEGSQDGLARKTKEEKEKIAKRADEYIKSIKNSSSDQIKDYVDTMQISDMVTSKRGDRAEYAEQTLEIKKKKRAEKLNQILNVDIADHDSADSIIDSLKEGKALRYNEDEIISLTPDDASEIVQMLLMRKELESINDFTKEELELKKGSNSYKDAIKQKSAKTVDFYKEQLDYEKNRIQIEQEKNMIENFKRENRELFDNNGVAKSGTALDDGIQEYLKKNHLTSDKKIRDEFENIKGMEKKIEKQMSDLKTKKAAMQAAERNVTLAGPIADIKKFINDNY